MKAKYYRYLFHRVTDGLCYSGSISNQMQEEREDLCFLYLAGGKECQEDGESYTAAKNRYDFLILGDLAQAAVERACRVARSCFVGEILMPDGEKDAVEKVAVMLSQAGAQKIRVVKQEEWIHRCREVFQIIPAGHGETQSLMLYHADEKDDPVHEECLICVKPVMEGMNCISTEDADRLTCEMRCMLYNDFTLCKRHNQRDQNQFLDGHLLFASTGKEKTGSREGKSLYELTKQQLKKLRFLSFTDNSLSSSDLGEISDLWEKGYARYLVGTADTAPDTIKEISLGDPYRQFFAVSEQSGLCISGYYVPRKI